GGKKKSLRGLLSGKNPFAGLDDSTLEAMMQQGGGLPGLDPSQLSSGTSRNGAKHPMTAQRPKAKKSKKKAKGRRR
ncbi:MAG TPA: signal recognition particle protein, partial [Nitrolancea sp.]|nr:signal recognition particle protein [Nitrolancea sp.]